MINVNLYGVVGELVDEVCKKKGCTRASLCNTALEAYCIRQLKLDVEPTCKIVSKKEYDIQEYRRLSRRLTKIRGVYSIREVADKLEVDNRRVYSALSWLIRKKEWEFERKKVIGDFLTVSLTKNDAIEMNSKVPKRFKIEI